jgi:hypothetical protein
MNWRKSSHSTAQGQCVEVVAWRKASHSYSLGQCVEAGTGAGVVAVRDSKDPAGPRLLVSPAAWRAFTRSLLHDSSRVVPRG